MNAMNININTLERMEMETVMTQDYWERNYKREYQRELRKKHVNRLKTVLFVVIGTFALYGLMSIFAIVTEIICNSFLFANFI